MKWLARKWLEMRGWEFSGDLPPEPKMVVVGAPHTSNWDFVVFLAALDHYDVSVRYLGKHTLFRFPLGFLFTATGGIPVNRSRAQGVVAQATRAFEDSDSMILVIAPEGTREPSRWWKSGFLEIARSAEVPVVMAGIDYPSRTVTLSPAVRPHGEISDFMDQARAFYAGKRGLNPGRETPVALREEVEKS